MPTALIPAGLVQAVVVGGAQSLWEMFFPALQVFLFYFSMWENHAGFTSHNRVFLCTLDLFQKEILH